MRREHVLKVVNVVVMVKKVNFSVRLVLNVYAFQSINYNFIDPYCQTNRKFSINSRKPEG